MHETARTLELGAFLLEAPIGQGGMARVWRGIHRAEGEPVAIKLVTVDPARRGGYGEPTAASGAARKAARTFREALQNEVRAMARLDHPGIVLVHDYGQVSDAAERASGGELVAGSPYLVMELADGGTLGPAHVRSWPELVARLVALLEALAHAHARGVIHRDLKPSNVLIHGPTRSCASATSGSRTPSAAPSARSARRSAPGRRRSWRPSRSSACIVTRVRGPISTPSAASPTCWRAAARPTRGAIASSSIARSASRIVRRSRRASRSLPSSTRGSASCSRSARAIASSSPPTPSPPSGSSAERRCLLGARHRRARRCSCPRSSPRRTGLSSRASGATPSELPRDRGARKSFRERSRSTRRRRTRARRTSSSLTRG